MALFKISENKGLHAGLQSCTLIYMTTTTTTNTVEIPLPTGGTVEAPTQWYPMAPEFRRIPQPAPTLWADVPGGQYANHRDPVVAAAAYCWRQAGLTYQQVADRCQIQTFRMAEQAVARYARQWGQAPRRSFRRQSRTVTARRFGIELEFNAARYSGPGIRAEVVNDLVANGIRAAVEHYNHDVRPHWKMTTDATVSGGECVSPIMDGTPASVEEVLQVIRTIKARGGTTGRNVGMHVHHDVNDFTGDDMTRLVGTMRHLQNALVAYVPRHRYDGSNSYGARMIREREWDMLAEAVRQGQMLPAAVRTRAARNGSCPVSRYSAVNWNSVLTYGTVEIRLLGHTLNTAKVKTWIEATTAIFRAVKAGAEVTTPMTPAEMADWLVQNGGLSRRTADRYVAVCATRNPAHSAA